MDYVIQLAPSKGQPGRPGRPRARYITGFGPHVNFTSKEYKARRFNSILEANRYLGEQNRRDSGARVLLRNEESLPQAA